MSPIKHPRLDWDYSRYFSYQTQQLITRKGRTHIIQLVSLFSSTGGTGENISSGMFEHKCMNQKMLVLSVSQEHDSLKSRWRVSTELWVLAAHCIRPVRAKTCCLSWAQKIHLLAGHHWAQQGYRSPDSPVKSHSGGGRGSGCPQTRNERRWSGPCRDQTYPLGTAQFVAAQERRKIGYRNLFVLLTNCCLKTKPFSTIPMPPCQQQPQPEALCFHIVRLSCVHKSRSLRPHVGHTFKRGGWGERPQVKVESDQISWLWKLHLDLRGNLWILEVKGHATIHTWGCSILGFLVQKGY